MKIKEIIKLDYNRNGRYKTILPFLIIYRLGNYCYYNNHKIWLKLFKFLNRIMIINKHCSEIKFQSKIGYGIRIPHLNGIIISAYAEIGNNCTIYHQVTIGANENKDDYKNAPKIGNNVYIGAGAKVIGDITIGDNVIIGANAIVTKDVPAGYIVIEANKMKPYNKKVRDNL